MAGREQKAREGKWNGGFAPYGYRLENGELVIAEDEVEIIQIHEAIISEKDWDLAQEKRSKNNYKREKFMIRNMHIFCLGY